MQEPIACWPLDLAAWCEGRAFICFEGANFFEPLPDGNLARCSYCFACGIGRRPYGLRGACDRIAQETAADADADRETRGSRSGRTDRPAGMVPAHEQRTPASRPRDQRSRPSRRSPLQLRRGPHSGCLRRSASLPSAWAQSATKSAAGAANRVDLSPGAPPLGRDAIDHQEEIGHANEDQASHIDCGSRRGGTYFMSGFTARRKPSERTIRRRFQ